MYLFGKKIITEDKIKTIEKDIEEIKESQNKHNTEFLKKIENIGTALSKTTDIIKNINDSYTIQIEDIKNNISEIEKSLNKIKKITEDPKKYKEMAFKENLESFATRIFYTEELMSQSKNTLERLVSKLYEIDSFKETFNKLKDGELDDN